MDLAQIKKKTIEQRDTIIKLRNNLQIVLAKLEKDEIMNGVGEQGALDVLQQTIKELNKVLHDIDHLQRATYIENSKDIFSYKKKGQL